MSEYDERPRRRHGSTRTREPEYVETEETYIKKGRGSQDLVLRPRERDDDYDDDDRGYSAEIRRKSYREDYRPSRRTRSSGYAERDYYDDDYSDEPRSRHNRSSRHDDDYYSDEDRYPRRDRRKSGVEGLLETVGLGGVAATVIKKARSLSRGPKGRGDRGRRDSSSDRSHYGSRNRSKSARRKWQQAAKAAVVTGVIEAVRSRNEPGGWTGAKGQRIATAALGAAGIDGFLDRDPDRKSKRHIVESVVGGLAVNRLANGGRDADESRGRSQSRSRSRSRSVIGRLRSRSRSVFGRGRSSSRGRDGGGSGNGLKELAAVGGVAAVGKAIYDRVRSKSRGRTRRDASISSEDSYVPSRKQRYRERGEPEQDQNEDRGRSTEQATGGEGNRGGERGSSTSSISTTDLEHRHKKTRGKELLTAGLATVATIHAAHGVYSSMIASEKRHKLEAEGKITPEEARKRKSKNMLQDAAAVGIAALGIKSAFSEWKEVKESRHEKHELEAHRRRKAKARRKREQEQRSQRSNNNFGSNANYYQGAPLYGDANPYQAYGGNLPPPPVGAPSNRYP